MDSVAAVSAAASTLRLPAWAVRTSAATGYGIDALVNTLDELLSSRVRRVTVLLPYDRLSLAAHMRENGTVLREEYAENGVVVEGIVKASDLHLFTPYLTD